MQDFEHEAQAFAAQIEEELREGRLSFPTALDVSLRIKRLADNPETTLEEIAAVVRAEPVLSAKAVRMANSVLLSPYGPQITTVGDAVRRIGLSALRCLAYAVAAEQLAQDQRSQKMRLLASGLWMHSIDVAAWSHAIARHLGAVKPDTAMLAGMMVDIGQFFLLARAADYPALEENMERFAEFVSTWDQPMGRAVLEAFELPDTILDAFQYENPYGGGWPPQDLSDVVFLAGLAAETPNPFDTLLGVHPRALLETCTAGIDRAKFDELLTAARNGREELLAALVH
ncbi:HDOD domain-containing protein [Pseudothauera nasutitermitis]|uniref:HDOD domain-containing protein n=1 Tax=Pseudothauera nasutitermitis TaxID=2565930 RepID=A0A4S4B6H1_9RHOO|nr:HDOD domain-containing protein [Pseudothauera nasutitermitis]THF66557.1 HDOD domain-containing protein [Pseudothauera nasutitermitis]